MQYIRVEKFSRASSSYLRRYSDTVALNVSLFKQCTLAREINVRRSWKAMAYAEYVLLVTVDKFQGQPGVSSSYYSL